MAGSFEVVTLPLTSPNPTAIGFRQIAEVTATPEDEAFALRIMARVRSLQRMFIFDPNFAKNDGFRGAYFELLAIAKSAVQHPNGVLRQGESALTDFEAGALEDFGKAYRLRFFKNQLFCCTVTLILGIATVSLAFLGNRYENGFDIYVSSFGFVLIGIAITVSLAALWRNRIITWDNIGYLDPDGYPPVLRLLGIILLSLVLMVLLYKKALILGIGSVDLNNFYESRADAIMLGCFCGLSEMPAVKIVQRLFDTPKVKDAA